MRHHQAVALKNCLLLSADEARDFVSSLLNRDETQRPTAEQALQHRCAGAGHLGMHVLRRAAAACSRSGAAAFPPSLCCCASRTWLQAVEHHLGAGILLSTTFLNLPLHAPHSAALQVAHSRRVPPRGRHPPGQQHRAAPAALWHVWPAEARGPARHCPLRAAGGWAVLRFCGATKPGVGCPSGLACALRCAGL